MDARIERCGIISSCQSAATSEIVKALRLESVSCKKRCWLLRSSDADAGSEFHVDGPATAKLQLPTSYRCRLYVSLERQSPRAADSR